MEFLVGGKFLDQCIKNLIRPYRSNYNDSDLGPKKTLIGDIIIDRTDFVVYNQRNHKIFGSIYSPQNKGSHCVIYLHGNAGSRLDGQSLVQLVCTSEMSLCVFDFTGSGKSDGQYVTLGIQESKDCDFVIQHLQREGFRSFSLFGRSMGSVTAILYQSTYKNSLVKNLVLDSAFCNLRDVCYDVFNTKSSLPEFFFDLVFPSIKENVQKYLNCDPFSINLEKQAQMLNIPVLIVYSTQDKFILPHNSEKIIKALQCNHEIMKIKGDHNESRNMNQYQKMIDFIKRHTKINQHQRLIFNPDTSRPKAYKNQQVNNESNHYKSERTPLQMKNFDERTPSRSYMGTNVQQHSISQKQQESRFFQQNPQQILEKSVNISSTRENSVRMQPRNSRDEFLRVSQQKDPYRRPFSPYIPSSNLVQYQSLQIHPGLNRNQYPQYY